MPGTTTAPLSSFFFCKNVANLFLVVGGVLIGGVLKLFLIVVLSIRSGMNSSEEFNDLLPSQLFLLIFFVKEVEY